MAEKSKRFLARSVYCVDTCAILWWIFSVNIFDVSTSALWYRSGMSAGLFLVALFVFAPHLSVITAPNPVVMLGRLAEYLGMVILLNSLIAWLWGWPVDPGMAVYASGGIVATVGAIHTLARFGRWIIKRRIILLNEQARQSWSRIKHFPQPATLFSPITADSTQSAVTFAMQRSQPTRVSPFHPVSATTPISLNYDGSKRAAEEGTLVVVTLDRRFSALTVSQRFFKRAFDLLVGTFLLITLSPALLMIALLVRRSSPGPALFRQQRLGKHGVLFPMIKFRSMHVDAEERWQEVSQRDEQGHLIHKTSSDPRVTPLGRLIRRTSIDELPQLINVLRGEMSLVGPRPEMPYMVSEYAPWQLERFDVTPGITGWWQINGRSDRLMHLHTEDDIYYIRNYSFWLDIKILWKTIGVVTRSDGAF